MLVPVVAGPAFVEVDPELLLVLVVLPQFVPALHTHMPSEQRWPAAHVSPHPPQFWVSETVGIQAPSQKLCRVPQSIGTSESESPLAQ
ncbi:MAG TPA: hypothetical protein VFU02_14205 [Polyangiaceae bacterium]|nr:hypothetical protein [Polyangiaceae bacterium]